LAFQDARHFFVDLFHCYLLSRINWSILLCPCWS
jgi:hypothetical protein